jgi:hypothetical protein
MINPDMPVLDSHVLKNLGINPVGQYGDPKERIKRSIAAYEEICEWYESGAAKEWIKLFDAHYPEFKGRITGVKKIDLILWKMED